MRWKEINAVHLGYFDGGDRVVYQCLGCDYRTGVGRAGSHRMNEAKRQHERDKKHKSVLTLMRFLIIKAIARVGPDWYATVDAVHEVAAARPSSFDETELHSFEEWEEIVGMKRRLRG